MVIDSEVDRAFTMQYAINKDIFEEVSIAKKIDENKPFDMTQHGIRQAFLQNKYLIVACMWVGTRLYKTHLNKGTVGATLIYNFKRTDIRFPQKLINMRLTGQSAALIGLGAVAFVNSLGEDEKPKRESDAHFDAVVNQGKHK